MDSEYVYEKKIEAETISSSSEAFATNVYRGSALFKDTPREGQRLSTFEFSCLILRLAASSACMLFGVVVMNNYEVLGEKETKAEAGNATGTCLGNLCAPEVLRNPSPEIFIFACITFGLAAISYYCLHKNDKHQTVILWAGLQIGLAATGISYLATRNPFEVKTYIPLSIFVALTLSSATHRVFEADGK